MFNLRSFSNLLGNNLVKIVSDADCMGLVIDSRRDVKNKLFVAFSGEKVDGNKFINKAIENGASAVLTTQDASLYTEKPFIQVLDINKAIEVLSTSLRNNFTGMVVGITGSAGKTSIKNFCSSIFGYTSVVATQGNYNNDLGVAITLSFFDNQEVAIVEMGAGKVGDIKKLAQLGKPKICIISNVSEAHLEGFKTKDAIAKEKGNIIEFSSNDSLVVLNSDDEYFSYFLTLTKQRKVVSVGYSSKSDAVIDEIIYSNIGGSKYSLKYKGKSFIIEIPILGASQIQNSAMAFVTAYSVNTDHKTLIKNLKNTKSEKSRMELLRYKRCSVIDDSYNANPISMKNAFTFINKVNNKADIKYKIIAILGEMRELGENSDSIHKELGEWLKNTNTSCAYFYTIGRGAKILAESSGVPFSSFSSVEDAMSDTEVIQEIIEKEETLVLLKGSNSVGVTKFNQFLKNIK